MLRHPFCMPRKLRKYHGFRAFTHMQQTNTRLLSGEPPGLSVRIQGLGLWGFRVDDLQGLAKSMLSHSRSSIRSSRTRHSNSLPKAFFSLPWQGVPSHLSPSSRRASVRIVFKHQSCSTHEPSPLRVLFYKGAILCWGPQLRELPIWWPDLLD